MPLLSIKAFDACFLYDINNHFLLFLVILSLTDKNSKASFFIKEVLPLAQLKYKNK